MLQNNTQLYLFALMSIIIFGTGSFLVVWFTVKEQFYLALGVFTCMVAAGIISSPRQWSCSRTRITQNSSTTPLINNDPSTFANAPYTI